MTRAIAFIASLSLAVGTVGLVGCTSDEHNLPNGENGTTAGGNGAFGENPVRPGEYRSNTTLTPSATQPSSSIDFEDRIDGYLN